MSRIGGGIGGGLAARSANTTSTNNNNSNTTSNIGGIRKPTATNQAAASSTSTLQQRPSLQKTQSTMQSSQQRNSRLTGSQAKNEASQQQLQESAIVKNHHASTVAKESQNSISMQPRRSTFQARPSLTEKQSGIGGSTSGGAGAITRSSNLNNSSKLQGGTLGKQQTIKSSTNNTIQQNAQTNSKAVGNRPSNTGISGRISSQLTNQTTSLKTQSQIQSSASTSEPRGAFGFSRQSKGIGGGLGGAKNSQTTANTTNLQSQAIKKVLLSASSSQADSSNYKPRHSMALLKTTSVTGISASSSTNQALSQPQSANISTAANRTSLIYKKQQSQIKSLKAPATTASSSLATTGTLDLKNKETAAISENSDRRSISKLNKQATRVSSQNLQPMTLQPSASPSSQVLQQKTSITNTRSGIGSRIGGGGKGASVLSKKEDQKQPVSSQQSHRQQTLLQQQQSLQAKKVQATIKKSSSPRMAVARTTSTLSQIQQKTTGAGPLQNSTMSEIINNEKKVRQVQSKIGGGSSSTVKSSANITNAASLCLIPSFNVSLNQKQEKLATTGKKEIGGKISATASASKSIENKLPSFDLKTPQRMQLRPPQPIESIPLNPAALENQTPDQQQKITKSGLIVGIDSVNVVGGDKVKFREPPPSNSQIMEEQAPLPQQSSQAMTQASPIAKPINSAHKTSAPQPGPVPYRQSKLAEIRQRKNLLQNQLKTLQENKITNTTTTESNKQLLQLPRKQLNEEIIDDNHHITGDVQPITDYQEQQQPFQLQQHGKSKSDVVILQQHQKSDFSLLDSQLASIKEQLEQSRQRNPPLVNSNNEVGAQITTGINSGSQHEYPYQDQVSDLTPLKKQSSTPQEARKSTIPIMTEPDPCPFEQAQLSSDNVSLGEADDLLFDENNQKKVASDKDGVETHHHQAQDMEKPVKASGDETIAEDDANVSIDDGDGAHVAKINIIGVTKDFNFKLGINNIAQNEVSQPKEQAVEEEPPSIEAKKDEITRLFDPRYAKKTLHEEEVLLEPELSVTPRDWIRKPIVPTPAPTTMETIRSQPSFPAHQDLIQSQIIDRDQQASMMEGTQSQSFDQHESSLPQQTQPHTTLISHRRTIRHQKRTSPLIGGELQQHQAQQQQSFSTLLQNSNLETKIKNLQDSISNLPSRVNRNRSRASKSRGQQSIGRAENINSTSVDYSVGGDLNTDFSGMHKRNKAQNNKGDVRLSRISMPASFAKSHNFSAGGFKEDFSTPFQQTTPLNFDQMNSQIEDAENEDEDLLNDDFDKIHEAFTRSQNNNFNGPGLMIEEVDLDQEEEQEKAVSAIPSKLQEFRQQAQKAEENKKGTNTTSGTRNMTGMKTDFSKAIDKTPSARRNNTMVTKPIQSARNQETQSKTKGVINSSQSSTMLRQRTNQLITNSNFVSGKQQKPQQTTSTSTTSQPDLLPNGPPQRSRLETLALPKQRKSTQQNSSPQSKHSTNTKDNGNFTVATEMDKPKHMFRNAAKGGDQGYNSSNIKEEAKQQQQTLTSIISPQPKGSSNNQKQKNQNLQTTSQLSGASASRKTATSPQQTTTRQRNGIFSQKQSGFNQQFKKKNQEPNSARDKKISQIALYKDRQPIIGLRSRYFTAAVQQKYNEYQFSTDEFNTSEHPLEKQNFVQCPICKRSFNSGVFAEIHGQNDLCKKVFIQQRLRIFDSQSQRINWNQEMSLMLQQAKSSIKYSQRNKLNANWQQKQQLFKKQSLAHKQKARGRSIDKLRVPVIADPDNPEYAVIKNDLDHSLFMADLSTVNVSRSQSEFGGGALLSNRLNQTMDFEVAPEVQQQTDQQSFKVQTEDLRVPCDFCGRKFNPDVSLKHIPICQRNYEKKHGPLGAPQSRRQTVMSKKTGNL